MVSLKLYKISFLQSRLRALGFGGIGVRGGRDNLSLSNAIIIMKLLWAIPEFMLSADPAPNKEMIHFSGLLACADCKN